MFAAAGLGLSLAGRALERSDPDLHRALFAVTAIIGWSGTVLLGLIRLARWAMHGSEKGTESSA